MVKCTCGKQFKNMGKLMRHLAANDGALFKHRADTNHSPTAGEFKRYCRKEK